MRSSLAVLPLLIASAVSSRSFFGGKSQTTLADEYPVPGKNPLHFCNDPDKYILEVDFVDLVPNPPVPGELLTINATGTVHQDIEAGAKVHLQVKYGLITLINTEEDLCDNLPQINITCPVKKGPLSISKEVKIPKQVPPGTYTVMADATTNEKEELSCMNAKVVFPRH